MRLELALVLAAVCSPAVAQQPPPPLTCGTPIVVDDGWPIDTPENVGLNGERLCGIGARLKALNANVHSVVIVRRGKLVFEQYFSGYDEPWGVPNGQFAFNATTKHDMRSVSKSVTSLLMGIAIDRKLIASVEEPVVKFFPEYAALKPPRWDSISLRNLLTMSSGLKWDESLPWTDPRNDEPHLGNDSDPIRYVLTQQIALPPDAIWNYNGGGTDLIGNIIARVSGKPFDAFAREVLFQPLGITDWEWKTYQNGKIAPAAGLRLRPRDAAKIGQLVLNRGAWAVSKSFPQRGSRSRSRRDFKRLDISAACSSTATSGGSVARWPETRKCLGSPRSASAGNASSTFPISIWS